MRYLKYLSTLLGITSAASVSIESRGTPSGACNNSPLLCNKPYSSVVHLGAHDSAFVRDATTGFSTAGNQYYNSTVQLSAGVRLLTTQVHKSNGAWHLCHSSCDLLDAGLLSTWLTSIKNWMDANPNDVVTILIVNSDNASPTELHQEFTKSGILKYKYTPPSAGAAPALNSWPTLQSLISGGTRLMTFVASVNSAQYTSDTTYLMNEFLFIFENNYNNNKATDFSCAPNRPTGLTIDSALASNRMPLMNHFLYQTGTGLLADVQTPDVSSINTTNSPSTSQVGMLGNSAATCKSQYGGLAPTFILVDFFDEGPAIQAVDNLNGVSGAVGRTAVPPRPTKGVGNAVSWAGVQALVQQVNSGESPSLGAWIWASGKWSWGGINLSGGDVLS